MTEAITITISGIKCDGLECDYIDRSVSRENYLEYVDKPCPECGTVLLTQADYDTVVQLEGIALDVNLAIPANILDPDDEGFSVSLVTDTKGGIKRLEKKIDPVD